MWINVKKERKEHWCSVNVGRKYLLEVVHSSLQRITTSSELNSHLPLSVDNMLCIADELVAAADLLPTLLMYSDEADKQVYVLFFSNEHC